jgi:hypothetical protein
MKFDEISSKLANLQQHSNIKQNLPLSMKFTMQSSKTENGKIKIK